MRGEGGNGTVRDARGWKRALEHERSPREKTLFREVCLARRPKRHARIGLDLSPAVIREATRVAARDRHWMPGRRSRERRARVEPNARTLATDPRPASRALSVPTAAPSAKIDNTPTDFTTGPEASVRVSAPSTPRAPARPPASGASRASRVVGMPNPVSLKPSKGVDDAAPYPACPSSALRGRMGADVCARAFISRHARAPPRGPSRPLYPNRSPRTIDRALRTSPKPEPAVCTPDGRRSAWQNGRGRVRKQLERRRVTPLELACIFYPYVRANSLYFYIRILTTDTRNTAFLVFILLFSASPFHPDAAAVAAHDTDYM